MIHHFHIPSPPLSEFVALFWYYEGYALPHAKERLLPTGTTELVINLLEDRIETFSGEDSTPQTFRGGVVCGPHSEYFVIDTSQEETIIGVHFKPGGAFPFFKLPAGELHNLHVSLGDLWGSAAFELRERLLAVAAPQARLRLLEQFLLTRLAKPLARHPAVSFALKEFQSVPHARTITELTNQIGLSARRFIQVFGEQVGLTPKLYCRVQRFQEVLRQVGMSAEVDWVDVAASCGYFDQAHFIHDFQNFSGFTPTVWLGLRSEHANHVPLPD
jgi:AraC-like DNA-binding protein